MKKTKKILFIFGVVSIIVLVFGVYRNYTSSVQASKNSEFVASIEKTIAEANRLSEGYFFEEAVTLLENDPYASTGILKKEVEKIKKKSQSLVLYDGEIYHVFFHSLIVYPELAFDGDYDSTGYNLWMTTVDEFKRILDVFLESDYILIDIHSIMHKTPDGKIVKKDLYLPEGKKPLIISVDDVNYYEYMQDDGFSSRLVLNEEGKVRTLVVDKEGNEMITDDGDVVPILDDFCEKNPEFSFRGARGILAMTGYEGALGYRITKNDTDIKKMEEEKEELVSVVKALRENGWSMACHSYTHNNSLDDTNVDMEIFSKDTMWWKEYIEPYVGYTDIYITAFGAHFSPDSEHVKFLNSQGFDIVCPVDPRMKTRYCDNIMISERLNLDGSTMLRNPEKAELFFDSSQIVDKNRPPIN